MLIAASPQREGRELDTAAVVESLRFGGRCRVRGRLLALRPREGESIGCAVAVRNVTDEEISVTGAVADEDREGCS